MNVVKVRRVGNSNVVSLPRSLEVEGYAPGSEVVVDLLPSGELIVQPVADVRKLVRDVGTRLVKERQQALQILADHDSGK